jgi:hypothetical protein
MNRPLMYLLAGNGGAIDRWGETPVIACKRWGCRGSATIPRRLARTSTAMPKR